MLKVKEFLAQKNNVQFSVVEEKFGIDKVRRLRDGKEFLRFDIIDFHHVTFGDKIDLFESSIFNFDDNNRTVTLGVRVTRDEVVGEWSFTGNIEINRLENTIKILTF